MYLHQMKPCRVLAFLIILSVSKATAQHLIRLEKANQYISKNLETVGHAYYIKSVNKDFAILKLAYTRKSVSLLMYYKFKYASSFASLTNNEFGHFKGNVILINNTPVLVVQKLHDATFYVPNDERVDSGLYYLKKSKF
jgi:hypothetical protein